MKSDKMGRNFDRPLFPKFEAGPVGHRGPALLKRMKSDSAGPVGQNGAKF